MPFSRELWIERDDFMENPPSKFYRLSPGKEVRLRYAYFLKCEEAVKDAAGHVVELRCTYDPGSLSGDTATRRVKGTIHWVSAQHAVDATVRPYDRLFTVADPNAADDFMTVLNPHSLDLAEAKLEPSLRDLTPGEAVQFERLGYFCTDARDHAAEAPVFNRIVTLRDSWAKIETADLQNKGQAPKPEIAPSR